MESCKLAFVFLGTPWWLVHSDRWRSVMVDRVWVRRHGSGLTLAGYTAVAASKSEAPVAVSKSRSMATTGRGKSRSMATTDRGVFRMDCLLPPRSGRVGCPPSSCYGDRVLLWLANGCWRLPLPPANSVRFSLVDAHSGALRPSCCLRRFIL